MYQHTHAKPYQLLKKNNKQTLALVHSLPQGYGGHVDKIKVIKAQRSVYTEETQTFRYTLSDCTNPEGHSSPR